MNTSSSMKPDLVTVWDFIAPRCNRDVARLYLEARVAGLTVSHYPSRRCRTYDTTDGVPGVARAIGSLIFYKDARRWEVRARSDCNATELATLISLGLGVVETRGGEPGYWTRQSPFKHLVSKRTGKRIACAGISYLLDVEDLMSVGVTAEEMPDLTSLAQLLTEVSQ